MEEVKKVSLNTVLRLSGLETPVGLYKTSGKGPEAPEFERVGPNARPLHTSPEAAKEAFIESEPEASDPVGVDETAPRRGSGPSGAAAGKRHWYEEGEEPEAVTDDEVRRGVRGTDGEFVDLTDQLERIAEESSLEALEISAFIRRERVPRERVVGSYYLAAGVAGDGQQPSAPLLRLLYEAMRERGRVAIVRWTKRKGQTLGILVPRGDGALVVLEMEWADRMRVPNAKALSHMRAEVTREEVVRAGELIEALKEPTRALDDLEDPREMMERELAEETARTGKPAEILEIAPDAEGLPDLAEVLESALAEVRA
jgi:non-homologous end joining protein Ku